MNLTTFPPGSDGKNEWSCTSTSHTSIACTWTDLLYFTFLYQICYFQLGFFSHKYLSNRQTNRSRILQSLPRHLFIVGVEVVYFHLFTLRHTPQSVGLLWMRDRPVADTSTWQHKHSQERNIHAPGGIRAHNPRKHSAADLREQNIGWSKFCN
jgi:hypothetical protein